MKESVGYYILDKPTEDESEAALIINPPTLTREGDTGGEADSKSLNCAKGIDGDDEDG